MNTHRPQMNVLPFNSVFMYTNNSLIIKLLHFDEGVTDSDQKHFKKEKQTLELKYLFL
jgi:hypothetical protein